MYRKLPLMMAFSALLASPIAWSAEQAAQHPSEKPGKQSRHAERAHLTQVSGRAKDAVAMKADHREVVALAPNEAEVDGWRVRLAAAGPASEVTQDLIRHEDEQDRRDMNVLGMLAAALGLGVMSIVRRMGRF